MTADKRDDKKKADLTDGEPSTEISDAELEQVAGGLSRTTLSTSSTFQPISQNLVGPVGPNLKKTDLGIGNDTIFAGATSGMDPLKR